MDKTQDVREAALALLKVLADAVGLGVVRSMASGFPEEQKKVVLEGLGKLSAGPISSG